jgi:hypothetical protein
LVAFSSSDQADLTNLFKFHSQGASQHQSKSYAFIVNSVVVLLLLFKNGNNFRLCILGPNQPQPLYALQEAIPKPVYQPVLGWPLTWHH